MRWLALLSNLDQVAMTTVYVSTVPCAIQPTERVSVLLDSRARIARFLVMQIVLVRIVGSIVIAGMVPRVTTLMGLARVLLVGRVCAVIHNVPPVSLVTAVNLNVTAFMVFAIT